MPIACGFALLQAERQQVAVDRLQLSRKPAWAVQAYHALRLLPAVHADVDAEPDHFVIYQYWLSQQVNRLGAFGMHPCSFVAAPCDTSGTSSGWVIPLCALISIEHGSVLSICQALDAADRMIGGISAA
jgi:hypothetical protein